MNSHDEVRCELILGGPTEDNLGRKKHWIWGEGKRACEWTRKIRQGSTYAWPAEGLDFIPEPPGPENAKVASFIYTPPLDLGEVCLALDLRGSTNCSSPQPVEALEAEGLWSALWPPDVKHELQGWERGWFTEKRAVNVTEMRQEPLLIKNFSTPESLFFPPFPTMTFIFIIIGSEQGCLGQWHARVVLSFQFCLWVVSRKHMISVQHKDQRPIV